MGTRVLVGLWLVSTLVYGVLQVRDQDQPPPYWTASGHTDQGEAIRLHLDADRRVRTFELAGHLRCTGGGLTGTQWHPSESGAPARFGSRGPRFDARESSRFTHADGSVSTAESRIRGHVALTDAHGTLELTSTYRWPDGRHQECSSGSIAWAAA